MAIETIKALPDDDVYRQIRHIIPRRFPTLAGLQPELNIAVQFRTSDKEGKPALKFHGYPALAVIRVVGLEDRLDGGPDVRITIDQDRFYRLTAIRQEAVLTHELMHVEFPGEIRDQNGCLIPLLDLAGRPKIALRCHDFEIGGFDEICEWYGADAIEKVALTQTMDRLRQMPLPFEEDDPGETVAFKGKPDKVWNKKEIDRAFSQAAAK